MPRTDSGPADWLVQHLTGMGQVRDIVPATYEAHLRIEEVREALPLPLLRDVLSGHTQTPGTCWFAIWEGYPLPDAWRRAPKFNLPERDFLIFTGGLDDLMVIATEFECAALDGGGCGVALGGVGRPATPVDHRKAAAACRAQGAHLSPSLWWPEDRAWVVASEVDSDATHLGGSRSLADDLLRSGLAVTTVEPDVAITIEH